MRLHNYKYFSVLIVSKPNINFTHKLLAPQHETQRQQDGVEFIVPNELTCVSINTLFAD